MGTRVLDDEQDLLQKIAGADQRAFNLIYQRYHTKIYTFSLRLLRSKQLAEEVLQESFLKIWVMGDKLPEVNNIEAFLMTTAKNKCLDLIRQRQKFITDELSEDHMDLQSHNSTEESILLQETKALLEKGIAELTPQQQQVYLLCHHQGLKYEEVAKRLNLSPLTVKTHQQLALRFLRKYMVKHSPLAIAALLLKIM